MNYSTYLTLLLATLASDKLSSQFTNSAANQPPLDDLVDSAAQQLLHLVEQFRANPITPEATLHFEHQLQTQIHELGREVLQHTFNSLEPADVQTLPKHVRFQTTSYTRLNRKTNQNVWTLFGQLRLSRIGYRSTCKNGEPTLFPLAQALGLIEGATPALASHVGQLGGSTGMTQGLLLQRLRRDNRIGWGVKKLRQVLQALSVVLEPHRHPNQVDKLVELLEQARTSKGKQKPVLSVGRDGITLGIRRKKGNKYEVATTATVSVFDRSGKRLGTVYLAYSPQKEQRRMSQELTRLLNGVLLAWTGPLPNLCYVSDAGQCESRYYKEVLSRMVHPRTGQRLEWTRVVDFYHASQRIWKLSECLFGNGREGKSWARKMLSWLKQGGVNRVLHSATAHRVKLGLEGKKVEQFRKAYNYLRKRMKHMKYNEYRRLGMPLGSGVTEAACKTIYTQRLKLSGQRWTRAGAQVILDLRILLLSNVWDAAFQQALAAMKVAQLPSKEAARFQTPEMAA